MPHNGTPQDLALPEVAQPTPVATRSIDPDEPVSAAIGAALARDVARLQAAEAGASHGEVASVHRFRTTTRRLRTDLRVFEKFLEPDWAKPIADDLRWLAAAVGDVRDMDVMRERLRKAAGPSVAALTPLFAGFDDRHVRASEALANVFRENRFRTLMERLTEAAETPRLTQDAAEPCRTALPPLVALTWSSLRKSGRSLHLDDPAEDFHDVRKRAKRARYAAEAVADALEPRDARAALRFAKLATCVQDVLGEHQDAAVACEEVRRAAIDLPADGPFNFAAGRLLERQEAAALAARTEFFDVWKALDRKRVRRWLHA